MRRGASGNLLQSNWFQSLRGGQSDMLAVALALGSAVVSGIVAIPAVTHWSVVLTMCGYVWWAALGVALVGLGTRVAQGIVTYAIVPIALTIAIVWAYRTGSEMFDLRESFGAAALPVSAMTTLSIQLVFFVGLALGCAILQGTMHRAYSRMSGR
ncbi:MAG: hypothetical protein ACSLE6_01410 [Mycobacterium sp.]